MGLLSTTFCIANIIVALGGSLLILIDTRLVLVVGALCAAWSAWRMHGWRRHLNATDAPELKAAA